MIFMFLIKDFTLFSCLPFFIKKIINNNNQNEFCYKEILKIHDLSINKLYKQENFVLILFGFKILHVV